jgi:hypothetical protein
MIIEELINTPEAAPEIENLSGALVAYREFRNEPALQMADMLEFISIPGVERDRFYDTLSSNTNIMNERYVKTILV